MKMVTIEVALNDVTIKVALNDVRERKSRSINECYNTELECKNQNRIRVAMGVNHGRGKGFLNPSNFFRWVLAIVLNPSTF